MTMVRTERRSETMGRKKLLCRRAEVTGTGELVGRRRRLGRRATGGAVVAAAAAAGNKDLDDSGWWRGAGRGETEE